MSDSESEYVITRKRVGGGYKDVLIKRPPVKTKRKSRKTSDKIAAENEAESEKQDVEVKEKEIEDCVPEVGINFYFLTKLQKFAMDQTASICSRQIKSF